MLKDYPGLRVSVLLICLIWAGISNLAAEEPGGEQSSGILGQINQIRKKNGVHELKAESAAMAAAYAHALELSERQTLSHWGRDGSRVTERYRILGGTGLKAGENLGAGDSAGSIIDAWMQSPGHKDNLLHSEWFGAGVGSVQIGNGRIIVVVVFSNSRWEQRELSIENNSVNLEGIFRLAPGVFPQDIFIVVDNNRISPFNASYSGKLELILRFNFPVPSEWEKNRIAAVPMSTAENGTTRSSDLIFLVSP